MNMLFRMLLVSLVAGYACLAQSEPIRVACIGDSNTQEANGTSWPKYMQTMLGDGYRVRNFGRGGTNGAKVGNPWRNTDLYPASTNFAPDIVIWMHGTNDSTHWNRLKLGETYREDIKTLLTLYRELPSKPVVIIANSPSMFQRDPSKIWGINADILDREVIPAIADIAKDLGVPLVDIHALTKNPEDGYIGPDGCHFTAKGKEATAIEIAKAVKAIEK